MDASDIAAVSRGLRRITQDAERILRTRAGETTLVEAPPEVAADPASVVAAETPPKVAAEAPPKVAAETSPKTSPESSPKTSPESPPKTSPESPPKTSPKSSPEAPTVLDPALNCLAPVSLKTLQDGINISPPSDEWIVRINKIAAVMFHSMKKNGLDRITIVPKRDGGASVQIFGLCATPPYERKATAIPTRRRTDDTSEDIVARICTLMYVLTRRYDDRDSVRVQLHDKSAERGDEQARTLYLLQTTLRR